MELINHIVVLITAGNDKEAKKISDVLLSERKAACINIIPNVGSLFWWKEQLDSAQESLLIIKTKIALLKDIIETIKELHSYEVPEIIALPIIGGNQDYLQWIDNEVKI